MTIPLAARNIKERHDVYDLTLMPKGPCDLNFRHPGVITGRGLFSTCVIALAIGAGLISLLLWGLRLFDIPVSWFLIGGVVLGIIRTLTQLRRGAELRALQEGITIAVVFPVVALGLVRFLKIPLQQLLLVTFVPATSILLYLTAERVCRHVVWWSTAHPRVPHRLMTLGRLLWSDRYLTRVNLVDAASSEVEAALLTRLQCGLGLVLRGMFLLLSLFVFVTNALNGDPASASVRLFVGLLGAQLLVFWLNGLTYPGLTRLAVRPLWHWLFVDAPMGAPPNVWRSPCGSTAQRRCWLLLSITCITFGWFRLEFQSFAANAPATWWQGALLLVRGVVVMCLVSGLALFSLYNLVAPVLYQYHQLFESRSSTLLNPQWTAFDGYNDRLQHSANVAEQKCLYRGIHTDTGFPILVDLKLHYEHQLILGATGIGKTALGLLGQISQLIRRREGAVIIIDCKGDPAMFGTAKLEAERQGATFKWFTNKPLQSTYIFNPISQKQLTRLTMQQIVGQFMMSLNLHHGSDYARAWFSMSSRMLFQEALREIHANTPLKRPFSFREIEQVLRRISQSEEEFRAAQHLAFIIANLGQFEQLNLSPLNNPQDPRILNGIHMPDVVEQKQVIYFNLIGTLDTATVGEIARLAIYAADSAALDLKERTGKQPHVHIVIDEAQMVVAQNFPAVMTQGRSHGLAFTLALQTLSQLHQPGGADLRELVINNASIQQYFSARDPETQNHIMKISGEVGYYGASWRQFVSTVMDGDVRMGRAVYDPDREPEPIITVNQEVGPRLSAEDIMDISRHPKRCVLNVGRAEGYSSYRGAFPVQVDFTMTEVEYLRRGNAAWPGNSEETIEIAPYWPEPNEHTVTPSTHPTLVAPGQSFDPDQLNEVRRRLYGE